MFNGFNDLIFGNPEVHENSFVSEHAVLIGRIIIEENVIIAPGSSLRADEGSPFLIRKGTNIQDGVHMHGLLDQYVEVKGKKYSIYIGSHCSIAHGALIHGPAEIGKKTFVGFKSIVHNSRVGRNCYIGFGAIVKGVVVGDRRYVEDGMIVNRQELADALPEVPDDKIKYFNREVVDYNKRLVELYQQRREQIGCMTIGL